MRTARILLVEDERIIAAGLRQRLTQMGHTVLATVASGADAIAQTPALSPTLVLMDIQLEGAMDGVEAGEYIHAHWGIPHSTELCGAVRPHSSKASRGEDLEVEHPV